MLLPHKVVKRASILLKSGLYRFVSAHPRLRDLILELEPKEFIARLSHQSIRNDLYTFKMSITDTMPLNAVPGRVVLVCSSLQPGGAERQVANTLNGLSAHSLESVTLLCDFLHAGTEENYDFYLADAQKSGATVRTITTNWEGQKTEPLPLGFREVANVIHPGLSRDVINLYHEFRVLKPEVVHAWLDWSNTRAGLAAVLAGVPKIILSCRNISPRHFHLHQPYFFPAYKVLVNRFNVTLLNNSQSGADDYADWLQIKSSTTKVLRNGVVFDDSLLPSLQDSQELRKHLKLPKGVPVVGGMFRFNDEKRPLLWLEAAAHIARVIPEARFVLFGQGNMREDMKKKAKALAIDDKIFMPGIVNPSFLGLSLFDVFLLTSRAEGTPNVLLEAQWLGIPVVTTNAGGASETVKQNVTGFVVDSDEASVIANYVIKAIRLDFQRTARKAGPSYIAQRYGMERMIDETLSIYDSSRSFLKNTG